MNLTASDLQRVVTTLLWVSILIVLSNTCLGQEPERLGATMSPDNKVIIVKEGPELGEKQFYFLNTVTGEKLGSVLTPHEHGLASPSFVASWNSSSSKLALLVYYGVRSSQIELFRRDAQRRFIRIDFKAPDPLSIYGKSNLRKLAEEHVNASENSLGPWTTDNSIRLVSGIMVDRGDSTFVHLFVTFTAIVDGNAKIKDVKLLGPYSDQEADKFLNQWGKKYWEENETEGETGS